MWVVVAVIVVQHPLIKREISINLINPLLMKKLFNKNRLYIIGAIAGAVIGYCYYKLIGCSTGSCPITSHPINSMLYFSLLGILFSGLFKKNIRKAN
jgi:hypothetical protein